MNNWGIRAKVFFLALFPALVMALVITSYSIHYTKLYDSPSTAATPCSRAPPSSTAKRCPPSQPSTLGAPSPVADQWSSRNNFV